MKLQELLEGYKDNRANVVAIKKTNTRGTGLSSDKLNGSDTKTRLDKKRGDEHSVKTKAIFDDFKKSLKALAAEVNELKNDLDHKAKYIGADYSFDASSDTIYFKAYFLHADAANNFEVEYDEGNLINYEGEIKYSKDLVSLKKYYDAELKKIGKMIDLKVHKFIKDNS